MRTLPANDGLHSAEAFHAEYLRNFFLLADRADKNGSEIADALRGKVIATVFEEPSTRTRLSFESAALKLGAGVITVADPRTSSHTKGESLRDSARTVGGYADLIVWRHPHDGASRLAAQFSGLPVINGGDGRLGHPSQTLVDLYTLYKDWGSFEGKTVGILGDLLHGRTARSLAWGLSLVGARIVILPSPGLAWEEGLERRLLDRSRYRLRRVRHPLFLAWSGKEEAQMFEPRDLRQADLFPSHVPDLEKLDALYLTRLQKERGATSKQGAYAGIQIHQLKDPLIKDALILHPLPRCEELPVAVDDAPGARYFEQTRLGPVVRKALFLSLLGPEKFSLPTLTPLPVGDPDAALGPCPNRNCISAGEDIPVPWRVEGHSFRHFLCAFCDTALPVEYAGCRSTRRLHPIHSPSVMRILPENLRPFLERNEAQKEGYVWTEA